MEDMHMEEEMKMYRVVETFTTEDGTTHEEGSEVELNAEDAEKYAMHIEEIKDLDEDDDDEDFDDDDEEDFDDDDEDARGDDADEEM